MNPEAMNKMGTTYDGIVIGAGVMGASCALHLASAGMKKVLVVEKGPGVGSGSTGRSTAVIRQTYSNFAVSLMAHEALQLFRNWGEFVGLSEERAHFIGCGVLFMFRREDSSVPHILKLHEQVGIRSILLSADDKSRMFPDIDFAALPPEDVEAGEAERHEAQALFEYDGGFADPVGTAQDMLDAARAAGAEVRFNTTVTEVRSRGGRVEGVSLHDATSGNSPESIASPVVVNCAGPWAMGINAAAGVPLDHNLVATRIQAVTKGFSEKLKGPLPVFVDMVTGIYGRLEANGASLVVGSVRDEDEQEQAEDPDNYNEVADAPFRERTLTLIHHRVGTFQTRGQVSSYAGLYTVNKVDSHPIIDESDLSGFYYVNGFSGHGFKLSPIVGMIVAQKVLGQWGRGKTEVPIDFFNKDRKPLSTNWGGVIA